MSNARIAFVVTLSACLLTSLGDMRGIITPAGYWFAWMAVSVFGLRPAIQGWKIAWDGELLAIVICFLLLSIAFLLSSMVNSDEYTFYQAFKVITIAGCFVVLHGCARFLNTYDYFRIAALTIAVGTLVFILIKYAIPSFYVQLGDGRQGSLFAWPGVLWKTGVFFAGFCIAQLLYGSRYRSVAIISLIGCLYLLVADSSRTGFLWFCIVVLVFGCGFARYYPVQVAVSAAVVGVCGVLGSIAYLLRSGTDLAVPLLLNRFSEGDPIREAMLAAGIRQADMCLPFGCGFSSTHTIVDAQPMVVHNSYLSSLGDIGLLGLMGMLGVLLLPVFFHLYRTITIKHNAVQSGFVVAAMLGVLGYGFLLMLHPLSTEMSEWGLWAIMTSALSSISTRAGPDTKGQVSVQ